MSAQDLLDRRDEFGRWCHWRCCARWYFEALAPFVRGSDGMTARERRRWIYGGVQ